MQIATSSYMEQVAQWPESGRVILAQFDDDSIIVYQAYCPAIGHFAARNGYFGGQFKQTRMTWIKPNFLWMMYRSNWGTSAGQEVVLAIRLRRAAFEEILRSAVHSSFVEPVYETEAAWRQALDDSKIRLQWDPDHDPNGEPVSRRAIQLGIGGSATASYARDWVLGIEDISGFVANQREHVLAGRLDLLQTPSERVYPLDDDLRRHLHCDFRG